MSTVNRWSWGFLQIPSAPAAANISSPLRRSLGPSRNPSPLSCSALSLAGADGPVKDGRKSQQHPQNWAHLIFLKEYEGRSFRPCSANVDLWPPHHSANPVGGACTLWVKCAKEADENTGFAQHSSQPYLTLV